MKPIRVESVSCLENKLREILDATLDHYEALVSSGLPPLTSVTPTDRAITAILQAVRSVVPEKEAHKFARNELIDELNSKLGGE